MGETQWLRDAEAVTAEVLRPAVARTSTFRDEDGDTVVHQLTNTRPGRWRSKTVGRHIAHLRRDADGAVRLLGEEDLRENVVILYKPALMLMPGTLTPGETFTSRAQMKVRRRDTGKERDRGRCRVQITVLGMQSVQTGDGPIEAVVVLSNRHIDLQLADVEVTVTAAYEPGFGLVAERVEQQIRALGLPGPVTVESMVLAERDADKNAAHPITSRGGSQVGR